MSKKLCDRCSGKGTLPAKNIQKGTILPLICSACGGTGHLKK